MFLDAFDRDWPSCRPVQCAEIKAWTLATGHAIEERENDWMGIEFGTREARACLLSRSWILIITEIPSSLGAFIGHENGQRS